MRSEGATRTGAAKGPFPRTDWRWAVLWALLAGGATALSVVAARSELLWGEAAVLRLAVSHLRGPLEGVGAVVEFLFTDLAAPIVFAVLLTAAWFRWGTLAASALLAAGAATALTRLADLVDRPPPLEDLTWGVPVFREGGYPSGHVVYGVLVFGTLAYLAGRCERRKCARVAIKGGCAALIVLFAPVRITGLDHWPGDVLGGYLLAAPALMLIIWCHRRAAWSLARGGRALGAGLKARPGGGFLRAEDVGARAPGRAQRGFLMRSSRSSTTARMGGAVASAGD